MTIRYQEVNPSLMMLMARPVRSLYPMDLRSPIRSSLSKKGVMCFMPYIFEGAGKFMWSKKGVYSALHSEIYR